MLTKVDLALLWLWHRLAAIALIQSPAWEPPYAVGATLEKPKKKKGGKMGLNFLPCKGKTTRRV